MKIVNADKVNTLLIPLKYKTVSGGPTGRLETIVIPPNSKSKEYTDLGDFEIRQIIVAYSPVQLQIEMDIVEYRRYSQITDLANYVYFTDGGDVALAGVVHNGTGVPPSNVGKQGDWYIDIDTNDMYGPKINDTTWPPSPSFTIPTPI